MKESELGLEVFLSESIAGIGGKLRKTPEDFVVDEISILPPSFPDGNIVIAKVWHRNWEQNRLVRRLGTNLNIGRSQIGFAGTKDGRSVSTQLMSFRAAIEAVNSLEIPDVRVLEAYKARRMISIGDLIGNRFQIRVADLATGRTETEHICQEVKRTLDENSGFPNFFGLQRFGSVRPITHLIGKDLIGGDVEGAVMRYAANPMEGEDSEWSDARRMLQETRDFERAFREYPTKLTFERMMIGYLKDNPNDYRGALRVLPHNLLMMFVHAYQSYLFNRTLSERVRAGISIGIPEVGDLILPLSKTSVPDKDNPIPVTEDNLEKSIRNAKEGKGFVSGLIYGTDSVFAEGRMGEIERKIVESEGIAKSDFQIVGLREASSKGTRRELLASPKNVTIEVGEDDVWFRFTLNKGCYATTMLREFMKAEMSQY